MPLSRQIVTKANPMRRRSAALFSLSFAALAFAPPAPPAAAEPDATTRAESWGLERARAAIAGAPDLGPRLGGPMAKPKIEGTGAETGGALSFGMAISDAGRRGAGRGFGLWSDGRWSYSAGAPFDLERAALGKRVGVDFAPRRGLAFGAMLGADWLDRRGLEADGLSAGPYAALALPRGARLDLLATLGAGANRLESADGVETGYSSSRLLLSARLGGDLTADRFTFRPGLRAAYAEERAAGVEERAADGETAAPGRDRVLRVEYAPELGVDLWDGPNRFEPFVGVKGAYGLSRGRTEAEDADPETEATLRGGVRLGVGRAELKGDLSLEGLDREDPEDRALAGSMRLRIPLW